jgi:lysozyme
MKVSKISQNGLELLKKFEGLSLKPYKCAGGIWTIGYGNTYYPDGKKVKETDLAITKEKANEMLVMLLGSYEKAVDSFCRDDINQNQFDALVLLAYNIGVGNLQRSTLIKKVNLDPNDLTIKAEFLKWNRSAGKVLVGLSKRREAEANLYLSK